MHSGYTRRAIDEKRCVVFSKLSRRIVAAADESGTGRSLTKQPHVRRRRLAPKRGRRPEVLPLEDRQLLSGAALEPWSVQQGWLINALRMNGDANQGQPPNAFPPVQPLPPAVITSSVTDHGLTTVTITGKGGFQAHKAAGRSGGISRPKQTGPKSLHRMAMKGRRPQH